MSRWIWITVFSLALTACASLGRVDSVVSTFGDWPASRSPGTFAFEHLPSQQLHPERQQWLEAAAAAAATSVGFRPADDPDRAQYLLQVGARVVTSDPWLYNAPLFWRVGVGYGAGYRRGHLCRGRHGRGSARVAGACGRLLHPRRAGGYWLCRKQRRGQAPDRRRRRAPRWRGHCRRSLPPA